ncbi:mannosyltransferase family protein [Alicyclobacillus sp. ALC3]|uniref:mannosyltransferase family protein n=1 Tax=Alicyclobacillus sp. ALC3 TaxID=2796143 RepID=UPI002379ACB9|nr:mannosyltransferase family protein [Alicyclobacillus sp. ALC3]WDL95233.1 hypothetical protein JC200_12480 [Alicyclobacillus sp. ALC3]
MRSALRSVWSIFVVHSVVMCATAAIWVHYFGSVATRQRGYSLGNFVSAFAHWDSSWFLLIAKNGYVLSNPNEPAFFPGFPFLMGFGGHALSFVRHFGTIGPVADKTYYAAGILISNVAFLLILMGLYWLGRMKYSERVTLRALWLLALFPSSYYFSSAYSESLFLLFVVFGMLFGYRKQWLLAAISIGLSALTRNLGIFVVASLLWLVWLDFREHKDVGKFIRNGLTVSAIPGFFLSLYLLLLYRVYQNPLMFLWAEKHHWHRKFTWIWTSLHADYRIDPLGFVASVVFLGLLVFAIRKIPLEQWILSAFFIIIPLLSSAGKYSPYPMSMIRFVLIAFPMFFYLGANIKKTETYMVTIATSAIFLVVLTGLFTTGQWVA